MEIRIIKVQEPTKKKKVMVQGYAILGALLLTGGFHIVYGA